MRPFRMAGLTAALLLAGVTPGLAQGMADLHAKVRVGNKLCMSDHYHSGQSSNQPSKAAAEKEAIQNWQDFTVWEYGGAWGSYAASVAKSMRCDGAATSWSCTVESRPCRTDSRPAERPRKRDGRTAGADRN